MPRYKPDDYDQDTFIPISYARQILPGTLEYTLSYLIDYARDLSVFDRRYCNDETGAPAFDPAVLLKEVAAGTGVVTRVLATLANGGVSIVAMDLNQAMLDEAAAVVIACPVQWQQADAMALPFADDGFDAVVCQFGIMFFPNKSKAFSSTSVETSNRANFRK